MKRKFWKVLGIIILSVILLVVIAASFVAIFLPNTGKPEDLHIERTAARVERGKYLANNVAACMDCHSSRDWSLYAGPIKPGNFGGGGDKFDKTMGLPGTVYAKNITPYALDKWTDGEVFRAITTGESRDGSPLFPMMPYLNYGKLDREDIYCIISYIRSLTPEKNDVPEGKLDFPVNIIMHTVPTEAAFVKRPSETDVVNYGKYMITMAGCAECHTNGDKGPAFAGGAEFMQPAGIARVANITPDKETGIGTWTKEAFVRRFKMYEDSAYRPAKMQKDEVNTPMPWMMYRGMKQSDLEAIYTYLQTVKPVKNKVNKFEKKPMAVL